MTEYGRRVSVFYPNEYAIGLWAREDFVKKCQYLFTEGTTILDIGCGSAAIKRFLPEGVTYVGIDNTTGGELCSSPDIVCDAGSIPLEDKCAEVISAFALDVFKIPGAVTEIKRLLKDDGYFVFHGTKEYFYLNNVKRLIRDHGFEIEEEFRQVFKFPGITTRDIYYICRLR